MTYGIQLHNDNGSAVLSADSIGYAYHSTQTHTDRISATGGINRHMGMEEVYSVANCPDQPKVFITDLNTFPEYDPTPPTTMDVEETAKMVMVTAIVPSADPTNYDWDIYILRGYDEESSATYPIRLLIFTKIETTPQIDYGLNLFDSSGDLSYDSGQKMLMPRMFAHINPIGIASHTYQYWNITDYATFLSDYGVTRPAFSVSGGYRVRDFYVPIVNLGCVHYLHSIHALHSEGLVTCIPRVGHSINPSSPSDFDACLTGGYPVHPYGDVYGSQGFQFYVIDADRYL